MVPFEHKETSSSIHLIYHLFFDDGEFQCETKKKTCPAVENLMGSATPVFVRGGF